MRADGITETIRELRETIEPSIAPTYAHSKPSLLTQVTRTSQLYDRMARCARR